ncbi:MAG: hypothetical protein Q8P41_03950 [Pseudomonadota bacterium]|nr:hypothetical protein [Pseudomonadota bacterium]
MLLLLLAACTGAAPEDTAVVVDPCVDAHDVTWVSFGDGFFSTYCRACHSAETQDRFGAPVGTDFDTLDQVRMFEVAIRRAAIEEETMPVGGGVYDDDLLLLGEFLSCGL